MKPLKSSNQQILSQKFLQSSEAWNLEQLYRDLTLAKRKYRASQTQRLTATEKAYLRGLLTGYSPPEIATEMNREPGGLRVDLSRGLYRYIEILTQQHPKNWKVIPNLLAAYQKEVINQIKSPQIFQESSLFEFENHLEVNISNHQKSDIELIDISNFFGRQDELKTLSQWIVEDHCRLVAILGLAGIGKSLLAAKLANHLKNEFESVIWQNLTNMPLLTDVLIDLIEVLSNQKTTIFEQFCLRRFPENFIISPYPQTSMIHFLTDTKSTSIHLCKDYSPQWISELIRLLRKHRCLIIFDNWEAIFCPYTLTGIYQSGYEKYGELLKEISTSSHQSCVLLTSSEKPKEIAQLEGANLPIRSLKLLGLGESARLLLKSQGLSEEEQWNKFIMAYSGNPLALKILATTIQDIFAGSLTNFLQYSSYLGDFREYLHQPISRLSKLEKQLICSIFQKENPISFQNLYSSFQQEFSENECLSALESLLRRSLLETVQQDYKTLFYLPILVRKYLITQTTQSEIKKGL